MPIPLNLPQIDCIGLMFAYSNYVIDGIERGIEPCCIDEFYDNEWQIGDKEDGDTIECPTCEGAGQLGDCGEDYTEVWCDECQGTGRIPKPSAPVVSDVRGGQMDGEDGMKIECELYGHDFGREGYCVACGDKPSATQQVTSNRKEDCE